MAAYEQVLQVCSWCRGVEQRHNPHACGGMRQHSCKHCLKSVIRCAVLSPPGVRHSESGATYHAISFAQNTVRMKPCVCHIKSFLGISLPPRPLPEPVMDILFLHHACHPLPWLLLKWVCTYHAAALVILRHTLSLFHARRSKLHHCPNPPSCGAHIGCAILSPPWKGDSESDATSHAISFAQHTVRMKRCVWHG